MDLEDGLSIIETAIEKEQEERAWQFWVTTYPHVENPKPFSEYLDDIQKEQLKAKQPPITAEEAIAKAERIRQAHQGKGG